MFDDATIRATEFFDSQSVGLALGYFELDRTSIHGPMHWARVLENGMLLAKLNGVSELVVGLFALWHDSHRHNDEADIFHGPRASKTVRNLGLGLGGADLILLAEAIAGHTNRLHSTNLTLATCWDADRLDISRCAREINPDFLTTPAAKRPDVIAWAQERGSAGHVPSFALEYL